MTFIAFGHCPSCLKFWCHSVNSTSYTSFFSFCFPPLSSIFLLLLLRSGEVLSCRLAGAGSLGRRCLDPIATNDASETQVVNPPRQLRLLCRRCFIRWKTERPSLITRPILTTISRSGVPQITISAHLLCFLPAPSSSSYFLSSARSQRLVIDLSISVTCALFSFFWCSRFFTLKNKEAFSSLIFSNISAFTFIFFSNIKNRIHSVFFIFQEATLIFQQSSLENLALLWPVIVDRSNTNSLQFFAL